MKHKLNFYLNGFEFELIKNYKVDSETLTVSISMDESEPRYIFIDGDDLKEISEWITKHYSS